MKLDELNKNNNKAEDIIEGKSIKECILLLSQVCFILNL